MKTRASRPLRHASLVLPVLAGLLAACSYDFDRFVREQTGGAAGGPTSAAGRSGGTGASLGGSGAGGVAGHAGGTGGDAGAKDEAGAAGAETTGSGGRAGGAGQGGTTNGAGQGGKPASAGTGGGGTSGGTGGATSSAGQGGKPGAGGSGGASCTGSGATVYGGHCYFLVGDDTPLDWSSAKTACTTHSSTTHLVTVSSKEEQAMLATSFFPSTLDTWIGLSLDDVTKDPSSLCKVSPDQCPFKWVTGEKLYYTNWTVRSGGDNEPNYTGACVRIQATDQTWGDTTCTGKLRAICEDG